MQQPAHYQPGTHLLCRRIRRGPVPSPDAARVLQTPRGDFVYESRHYVVVLAQHEDGSLLVEDALGGQEVLDPASEELTPMKWWEEIIHEAELPARETRKS